MNALLRTAPGHAPWPVYPGHTTVPSETQPRTGESVPAPEAATDHRVTKIRRSVSRPAPAGPALAACVTAGARRQAGKPAPTRPVRGRPWKHRRCARPFYGEGTARQRENSQRHYRALSFVRMSPGVVKGVFGRMAHRRITRIRLRVHGWRRASVPPVCVPTRLGRAGDGRLLGADRRGRWPGCVPARGGRTARLGWR